MGRGRTGRSLGVHQLCQLIRRLQVARRIVDGGGQRASLGATLLTRLVNFLIDFGDLFDPDLPLFVLHFQDLVEGPMEVVANVRYLLIEPVQGVAYDSPRSPPVSTSKE